MLLSDEGTIDGLENTKRPSQAPHVASESTVRLNQASTTTSLVYSSGTEQGLEWDSSFDYLRYQQQAQEPLTSSSREVCAPVESTARKDTPIPPTSPTVTPKPQFAETELNLVVAPSAGDSSRSDRTDSTIITIRRQISFPTISLKRTPGALDGLRGLTIVFEGEGAAADEDKVEQASPRAKSEASFCSLVSTELQRSGVHRRPSRVSQNTEYASLSERLSSASAVSQPPPPVQLNIMPRAQRAPPPLPTTSSLSGRAPPSIEKCARWLARHELHSSDVSTVDAGDGDNPDARFGTNVRRNSRAYGSSHHSGDSRRERSQTPTDKKLCVRRTSPAPRSVPLEPELPVEPKTTAASKKSSDRKPSRHVEPQRSHDNSTRATFHSAQGSRHTLYQQTIPRHSTVQNTTPLENPTRPSQIPSPPAAIRKSLSAPAGSVKQRQRAVVQGAVTHSRSAHAGSAAGLTRHHHAAKLAQSHRKAGDAHDTPTPSQSSQSTASAPRLPSLSFLDSAESDELIRRWRQDRRDFYQLAYLWRGAEGGERLQSPAEDSGFSSSVLTQRVTSEPTSAPALALPPSQLAVRPESTVQVYVASMTPSALPPQVPTANSNTNKGIVTSKTNGTAVVNSKGKSSDFEVLLPPRENYVMSSGSISQTSSAAKAASQHSAGSSSTQIPSDTSVRAATSNSTTVTQQTVGDNTNVAQQTVGDNTTLAQQTSGDNRSPQNTISEKSSGDSAFTGTATDPPQPPPSSLSGTRTNTVASTNTSSPNFPPPPTPSHPPQQRTGSSTDNATARAPSRQGSPQMAPSQRRRAASGPDTRVSAVHFSPSTQSQPGVMKQRRASAKQATPPPSAAVQTPAPRLGRARSSTFTMSDQEGAAVARRQSYQSKKPDSPAEPSPRSEPPRSSSESRANSSSQSTLASSASLLSPRASAALESPHGPSTSPNVRPSSLLRKNSARGRRPASGGNVSSHAVKTSQIQAAGMEKGYPNNGRTMQNIGEKKSSSGLQRPSGSRGVGTGSGAAMSSHQPSPSPAQRRYSTADSGTGRRPPQQARETDSSISRRQVRPTQSSDTTGSTVRRRSQPPALPQPPRPLSVESEPNMQPNQPPPKGYSFTQYPAASAGASSSGGMVTPAPLTPEGESRSRPKIRTHLDIVIQTDDEGETQSLIELLGRSADTASEAVQVTAATASYHGQQVPQQPRDSGTADVGKTSSQAEARPATGPRPSRPPTRGPRSSNQTPQRGPMPSTRLSNSGTVQRAPSASVATLPPTEKPPDRQALNREIQTASLGALRSVSRERQSVGTELPAHPIGSQRTYPCDESPPNVTSRVDHAECYTDEEDLQGADAVFHVEQIGSDSASASLSEEGEMTVSVYHNIDKDRLPPVRDTIRDYEVRSRSVSLERVPSPVPPTQPPLAVKPPSGPRVGKATRNVEEKEPLLSDEADTAPPADGVEDGDESGDAGGRRTSFRHSTDAQDADSVEYQPGQWRELGSEVETAPRRQQFRSRIPVRQVSRETPRSQQPTQPRYAAYEIQLQEERDRAYPSSRSVSPPTRRNSEYRANKQARPGSAYGKARGREPPGRPHPWPPPQNEPIPAASESRDRRTPRRRPATASSSYSGRSDTALTPRLSYAAGRGGRAAFVSGPRTPAPRRPATGGHSGAGTPRSDSSGCGFCTLGYSEAELLQARLVRRQPEDGRPVRLTLDGDAGFDGGRAVVRRLRSAEEVVDGHTQTDEFAHISSLLQLDLFPCQTADDAEAEATEAAAR